MSDTVPADVDPNEIILTDEDAPRNFMVIESRQKNITEVTDLALDLGWAGGYVVQYTDQSSRPTIISQTIAFYPAKNMQTVFQYVQKAEQEQQQFRVTDLPDPVLGDLSGASVAYAPIQQDISSRENSRQEIAYYEIIFTKGPVFEVFRMSGPSADYQTLSHLAQTALKKL